MKWSALLIIFILFNSSCINRDTVIDIHNSEIDSCSVYDVLSEMNSQPLFKVDELYSEIKIIKLETSESSILTSWINKVIVTKDFIYVCDAFNGGSIAIFREDGSFVKRLPYGQGPEDVLVASFMYYDDQNEWFYVSDQGNNKISKFTKSGDYISSVQLGSEFVKDFAVINGNYLFMIPGYIYYDKSYFVVLSDSLLRPVCKWFLGNEPKCSIGLTQYIYKTDDGFNFSKSLDNTVYCFRDNKIAKRLEIVDNRDCVDIYSFKDYKSFLSGLSDDEYIISGSIIEMRDYIYTSFSHGDFLFKGIIIDKHTKHIVPCQVSEGSLSSCFGVSGLCSYDDNSLYDIIDPVEWCEYAMKNWDGSNPNNLLSSEDIDKLKSIQPDDNPVIVTFKLKSDLNR